MFWDSWGNCWGIVPGSVIRTVIRTIPGYVPGRDHIFRDPDPRLAVVPGAPWPMLAPGNDACTGLPDPKRIRYFFISQPTNSIHRRFRELLWELFPEEAEPDTVKTSLTGSPLRALADN